MIRRLFAMLMALMLALSLIPCAFAEGEEGTPETETYAAWIGEQGYKTLKEAVNAAPTGETTVITLGEGGYSLYNQGADTKGKSLVFEGAGTDKTTWQIGAVVLDPDKEGTEYNGDYSFDGAASITFRNMTLQSGTANYLGFIRPDDTVVENCVINGKTFYWGYKTATFTNTTFNCPTGDYALWTYSSPVMTFDGCTFNATGKIINVYRDSGGAAYTVNVKDCTVNNTAPNKQVLNINDTYPAGQSYTINISGTNTINGTVPVSDITCSRWFGYSRAANNGGNTEVSFDGETVWKDGKMVDPDTYHLTGGKDGLYTEGYLDKAYTENTTTAGKATTTTRTCDYCGYTYEVSTSYNWDVSRSKTATALDANKESTVTLSLPSAEEQFSSDIVFVLDQSSCATAVTQMMPGLMTSLDKAIEETGAEINVGVVVFRGNAVIAYPLTQYKAENKAEIAATVLQAAAGITYKGSNLPAGLLAAQEMLKASDTDASRQYMILVSDAATYTYTHDGDYTSHFSRTSGYYNMDGSLYEWQAKYNAGHVYSDYDMYAMPTSFKNGGDAADWEAFLTEIGIKRADFVQYDQEYVRTSSKPSAGLTLPDPVCDEKTVTSFIINSEEAMYQAADVYQQLVSGGVNCYSIRTSDNMGVFTSFSKYLGGIGSGSGTDFSELTNDILYAVSKGSTVEDVMGGEFDLVADSFVLTVGDETLECKKDDNVYSFGEGRFAVTYNADSDSFVWKINEDVSNFAPVQLSYKVKLVSGTAEPGSYAPETNESAVLTPVDSDGHTGEPLKFEKPTASYTVVALSYDANGGKGTVAGIADVAGSTVTVAENSFTYEGYTFTGWNTSADGKGTAYKAGDTFTLTAEDTVLYAQWSKNVEPTDPTDPGKKDPTPTDPGTTDPTDPGKTEPSDSGKTDGGNSATSPTETKADSTNTAKTTKTGDSANLVLPVSLLILSSCGAAALIAVGRKKKQAEYTGKRLK